MKKFRDYKNDKHWDEEKHKEALERREIKNIEKFKADVTQKVDGAVKDIADIAINKYAKQEILDAVKTD